ncbi:unnamed protein product [Adineta steineri]|uniref:Uncharacterized protein n=1 Tax=Adineta steineri TaxID=433720 RepID=A0A814BGQ2_9BILA|nr:unnamed protein product [Adineta steineri]CAF3984940.1 unnamed protein product [Adineta steineri]
MVLRRRSKRLKLKYLIAVTIISFLNLIVIIFVRKYLNYTSLPSTSSTTTSTSSTSITHFLSETSIDSTHLLLTSSIIGCRQFPAYNNRSFYEREYPQLNLPQRISNSSYKNILHQLQSLRLIIISCVRNVASKIDKYQKHIEPILDLFHPSSRILIFESDSNDKTVEKLYQWSRAQVYTYGTLLKKYPDTTKRLAYCRNILLDKAHSLKADYILVTDIDIFSTTVSSFLSNFQYNINDWSVMTVSSSGLYHDIWALRTLSNSVMNYDVWNRIENLEKPKHNYCKQSLIKSIIGIHQKHIPIERGLIEVRSAFGGGGLYRANSTYQCKYNSRSSTCEHVPFHLCIRDMNDARIFINSQFQIV